MSYTRQTFGMRDLAREADLGVKAREAAQRRATLLRQELERDRLAELQVIGAIDLAHPAFAQQADDAVAIREHGPGRKPAVADRVRRREPPAGRLRRRRREPGDVPGHGLFGITVGHDEMIRQVSRVGLVGLVGRTSST